MDNIDSRKILRRLARDSAKVLLDTTESGECMRVAKARCSFCVHKKVNLLKTDTQIMFDLCNSRLHNR